MEGEIEYIAARRIYGELFPNGNNEADD